VTVTAVDAVWMVALVRSLGADPIIGGGWGVDALAGSQTRAHRDLDLIVPAGVVDRIIDVLEAESFAITTDDLPVRIELSHPLGDRHIDLHPAHSDGAGGWWQHGFDDARYSTPASVIVTGSIAGITVQCLSVARQLELHTGYELAEHDAADVATLKALVANDTDG
jgi:lincosamide nucleotidyltransferase A/C/D/E